MKAGEFNSKILQSLADRNDIAVKKYKLHYKNGDFIFLRIASKKISKDDKVILIRAGIHGEETAGPATMLKHINEIIDYAHKKNIKIIIYPLGNPSGFETGNRYNIDGDKGEAGNSDFMRYELANDQMVDDLEDRTDFKKWYWSSDKKFAVHLPKETVLMHRLLKQDLKYKIAAVLDLHQDYNPKGMPAFAYAYAYGDLTIYKNIVKKIKRLVPLYSNKVIDAGFIAGSARSDKNGFVVRHDGSLTDLLYRLGVKINITVETSTTTPMPMADKVNLTWIYGMIDLINAEQTSLK